MNSQDLLNRITTNPQILTASPSFGGGDLQWSMFWGCWRRETPSKRF